MKKLKAKKNPSAESYLFDISEWQRFTETVLPDWISSGAERKIAATTIEELLIKPLSAFIHEAHKKQPNSTLVYAGNKLLTYLEMDIVSKFRNEQTVVPEQSETLNGLVNEFFAIYGSGVFAKTSQTNSNNAQNDRKTKPTKATLVSSREAYYAENGKFQGWLKAAQNQYSLSEKTLKTILNSSEN